MRRPRPEEMGEKMVDRKRKWEKKWLTGRNVGVTQVLFFVRVPECHRLKVVLGTRRTK
jgi:hypothetical protein